MPTHWVEWRTWVALCLMWIGTLVSIGVLDVIRGRTLAVVEDRQQGVLHELDRLRDRVERLEARCR